MYTPDAGAVYPVQDIRTQGPLYVVSDVTSSDGVGGNYAMTYTYAGAKTHLQGGGFLGFRQFIVHDTQTGIKTTTSFRQNYPFQGMPLSVEKRTEANVLLNHIANTYTDTIFNGAYHQSLLSNSAESSYELNGGLVTTITTNTQYDAYGNPTQIVTGTGNGYRKTTNNTYTNDTTNWLLGRLTSASVTSATPNAGTLTRTSSFVYNPANGLLTQEVIEPNNVAYRVQTDYRYDAYGNKTTVTVSGSNIVTRTTATVFDIKGQFPIKTTNALNQSENGAYDGRFGVATSLTDPNGLTTTWRYDGFGRKVNETRTDGTQTNISYNICDATCPYNAKYYVTGSSSGAPASYRYYDMLSREIRVQVQGFDGRLVTKDTQYDGLGRVSQTSLPYYIGDPVYWTRVTYDQLNRPIQEIRPDGSTSQTAYNGLTTVSTNALGQIQTKAKNSQGQLVSATDTQGNVVSYQYDAFGNLTRTTDAKGNVIVLTYDLRGRKIAMSDPDMGYWIYQYNVLGQLVKQTDAKGQVVRMSYDMLGRMLSRNEPDLISNWTYDTMAKGIGKLAQVNSDNGAQRLYFYDAYGRVMRESNRIDTWYNFDTAYDVYGRISKITYPTGFAVIHIYNAYGYLAEVRNSANNALLWKANAKDAQGHVLNETLGNGLNTVRSYTATTGRIATIAVGPNSTAIIQNQTFYFDRLGNLTYRYDPIQGQSETFAYDNLNRLTSAASASGTVSLAYDSIGNITSKSDAGAYTYGAKPHAVTRVGEKLNATYSYDPNGNMTGGKGRTVIYSSYNLPTQITQGSESFFINYNANHERIGEIGGGAIKYMIHPRIDAGVHFEKELKNGVTTYKHYFYGGAGVIGVHNTTGATASTHYFHTDHLGSIVAVTDGAKVLARYKFDAWGKRIPKVGSLDTTHHGFTGHEHLDEVGLIHMNGRVYDPVLGRFMSADPYLQAPDNLQSYNRYAYVWNNPLSATDSSGYWNFRKWFRATTKAIFFPSPRNVFNSIRVQPGQARVDRYIMTHQWAYSTGQIAAAYFGGGYGAAAWSSYYGYVATGSVNAGVRAGVISLATSAAFNVVGGFYDTGTYQNVIGHAVVGCASSVASGGSCQSGAAGAALGAMADGYGIVVHMVAGGVGAELGGGKFANGAVMGAYGYLFNYCAHNGCFNRRFTLADARDQYRNGNGGVVTDVGASEIDLAGAGYIATKTPNVFQVNLSPSTDSYYVYGTVTGVLDANGKISLRSDTYNFDYKDPALGQTAGEGARIVVRNAGTFAGRVYNGSGVGYGIHFSGSQSLPPDTVNRLRSCATGNAC